MNGRFSRILAAGLASVLGFLPCAQAAAQVGPSKTNIKKPAPKKPAKRPAPRKPRVVSDPDPVVRVRTVTRPVRRKPVVARVRPPRVKKPPVIAVQPPVAPVPVKPPVAAVVKPPIRVPGPNTAEAARVAAQAELNRRAERMRVMTAWQQDELRSLELLARAADALLPPNLERVVAPDAPQAPTTTPGQATYRQKVTLTFVREDGLPLDLSEVQRVSGPLNATRAGSRLELEGPRVDTPGAAVDVALSGDWAVARPEDARILLSDFPGTETRVELQPEGRQPRVVPPTSAPLFTDPKQADELRQTLSAPKREAVPPIPVPRPAATALQALSHLEQARKLLSSAAPTVTSSVDARRAYWSRVAQADLSLQAARAGLQDAREAVGKLNASPQPGSVLGPAYKLDPDRIGEFLDAAEARLVQYAAEAEWLRATAENPAAPDRGTALRLLMGVQGADAEAQLQHYARVAEGERRYREALADGRLNPTLARPVVITHHLVRAIPVQRTVVDLRLAQSDLQAGDRVTLTGFDGLEIPFHLERGFWRARVPRRMVREGERLRFTRKTPQAEMTGEIALPKLDAYAREGNLLPAPTMRVVEVPRSPVDPPAAPPVTPRVNPADLQVLVTAGAFGEIQLFRELSPEQLKELRRDGDETPAQRDGTWWLKVRSVPVSLKLRRVAGQPAAGKRPQERVVVEGARLDAPAAGQVGGIRVGSSQRSVSDALGVNVERTGTVQLRGGAIELILRDGIVEQIVINRE